MVAILKIFRDDRVWTAITAEQGCFEVEFNETHFQDLFENCLPDLYFKVFAYHQQLQSTIQGTENSVLRNLGAGDTEVTIEVDIPEHVRTKMAKFHVPRQINNNTFRGEHFLCGHIIYHDRLEESRSQSGTEVSMSDYVSQWIERRTSEKFNLFQVRADKRAFCYYRKPALCDGINIKLIAQFPVNLSKFRIIDLPPIKKRELFEELPEELGPYTYKKLLDLIDRLVDGLAYKDSRFINYSNKDNKDPVEQCKIEDSNGEDPNVLAFAAHEEPFPYTMALVEKLHEKINEKLDYPVDFHLIYNRPSTYDYDFSEAAQPLIMSIDWYTFSWDFTRQTDTHGNNLSRLKTPRQALNILSNEFKRFGKYVRKKGSHFQAVISAEARLTVVKESQIAADHNYALTRVRELANDEMHGWKNKNVNVRKENGDSEPALRFFKRYHPPKNCTRAMVWLAVMNGAQSILNWLDTLPHEEDENVFLADRDNEGYVFPRTGDFDVHMTGTTRNRETPEDDLMMLEEYADTCRTLQDYGWLINHMEYIANMEDIANAEDNERDKIRINLGAHEFTFHVVTLNVDYSVFHLPGYTGLILVVVNKNVGFWSGTNLKISPRGFVEEASTFFEARNNPGTYYPYPSSDSINNVDISIARSDAQINIQLPPVRSSYNFFDFDRPHDALFREDVNDIVAIRPGGGKFLFYGPQSEFRKIRSQMGFSN